MGREKAYDRVDREALWNVLYIHGVGGQLLKGIQAFYREANACLREGKEGLRVPQEGMEERKQ